MTDHPPEACFAEMRALILDTRSQAALLHCAAELRLADHLAGGSRTAAQIAADEKLDVDATERMLRGCASFGLVLAEGGRYRSTPLLDTLRSDDQHALREAALAQLGYAHWTSWGRLADAVRSGQTQIQNICGKGIFDYYGSADGADESQAFTRFLAGFNRDIVAEAARLIDTGGVKRVLDVGGAGGSLVMALMEANPSLHGAVFDVGRVEPEARREAQIRGLTDRFDYVAGDFFIDVPTADMYLLKNVLHDWSDDDCRKILSCVRAAATPGQPVIVAETVIDGRTPSRVQAEMDLTMLVLAGGRERTIEEFGELFNACGFEIVRVQDTATPFSFIWATSV